MPLRKVLLIQPQNTKHWNFDRSIIDFFCRTYDVTFYAPEGYLNDIVKFNITRINISREIFTHSGLRARLQSIKTILNINNLLKKETFDIVFFLSYDTLSLSMFWQKKAIICEHNNLDGIENRLVKRWMYKKLNKNIISIALSEHIVDYVQHNSKREVFLLNHPLPVVKTHALLCDKNPSKIVIFSPSGGNNDQISNKLKDFVRNESRYFAYIKGKKSEAQDNYLVSEYFQNYEEILESCSVVYIGGDFNNRVSGVVFEALFYGKLVVMHRNKFSLDMKRKFPNMVKLINNIEDILHIENNISLFKADYDKFLQRHSQGEIDNQLVHTIEGYDKV